jgi:hypothetical protein
MGHGSMLPCVKKLEEVDFELPGEVVFESDALVNGQPSL